MNQDTTVIGYLGRALSFELSAVQQYLSVSKLLEMRGMAEAAKHFKHDALEELEHAERIIARMLALGFSPNASQLKPAKLKGSLVELMQQTEVLEKDIVILYTQASKHCMMANDHENRMFFETLLQEEQQHAQGIATWLQKILDGQTKVFDR